VKEADNSSVHHDAYRIAAANPLTVAVVDPTNPPNRFYPDCQVSWTPGTNSGFLHPVSATSDDARNDGKLKTWWIAGTATSQTATATISRRNTTPASIMLTASVVPQSTKQLNRYAHFAETAPQPSGYSLDVKVISATKAFLAGPIIKAARVGIQDSEVDGVQKQRFQFSFWRDQAAKQHCPHNLPCVARPKTCGAYDGPDADPCTTDADCSHWENTSWEECGTTNSCDELPDEVQCNTDEDCHACDPIGSQSSCLRDHTCRGPIPEEIDPHPGVDCTIRKDGNPDYVARTCDVETPDNNTLPRWPQNPNGPLWVNGDTVRMRLLTEPVGESTRLTFLFANLNAPNPTPFRVASLERYPAAPADREMTAFIEQLAGAQFSNCYLTPLRAFEVSNPKYLPNGADPNVESNWVAIDSASVPGAFGCQNDKFATVDQDSFLFSVGGSNPAYIGPPWLHPERKTQYLP
jgi:hypothetical protein